ncbi:MAG TPA: FtsX-like permease family protein [Bacteroidales bacterium]|nr:FtsX-like permease family protein [Bacteroidales bacterium]
MNTELFIARRTLTGSKANFSRPVVRIAIAAIALGLAVMFVAVAILTGFQKEVRDKVIGFGSHILVTKYDENSSLEPKPVSVHQEFYPSIEKHKGIRHIQVFATKAGIIRTHDQIEGAVLKGIGRDYDWSFFRDKIIRGSILHLPDSGKSNDVLISKTLASLLKLKLNDDLRMYFISGENTLGRKFRIAGIYETGLEEFDKMYVLCDIRHIQKLNGWEDDQVGGFEILLDNFRDIDKLGEYVYHRIGYSLDARTIKQLYPQIFDWLALQDINVLIILVLMILVAGITMISTLLILILERTNTIGILKSLGMRNRGIRRIFLYHSAYLIGLGLFWGNVIGLGICLIQKNFGILTLPQESYYMPVVPINLDLANILLLNLFSFIACFLMLILPSFIITRISPVKAIRYS